MQKAAALEIMRLTHLEVQIFDFALEGLFLAEVAVDFSSQGDAAVVQTDLYIKKEWRKIPLCEQQIILTSLRK